MKVFIALLLLFCVVTISTTNPLDEPRHFTGHREIATTTRPHDRRATSTQVGGRKPTPSPNGSKTNKKKHSGLTKGATIGIAVGVSVGTVGVIAAISAYVIGKRRGRKRRVDDPTAGANKLIKDPSNELNVRPHTPDGAIELPTEMSSGIEAPQRGLSLWWKPFRRSESSAKNGYTVPPGPPLLPQELPA